MDISIADLLHVFEINGRRYAVEVCGCDGHDDDDHVQAFERISFKCDLDELKDSEDDGPDALAAKICESVRYLLPDGIDADDWGEFAGKLRTWVCAHRALAVTQAQIRDAKPS